MALKDWKKQKGTSGFAIVIWNKYVSTKGDTTKFLRKKLILSKVPYKVIDYDLDLYNILTSESIHLKSFKTKAQAMSYAKAYMRSH